MYGKNKLKTISLSEQI